MVACFDCIFKCLIFCASARQVLSDCESDSQAASDRHLVTLWMVAIGARLLHALPYWTFEMSKFPAKLVNITSTSHVVNARQLRTQLASQKIVLRQIT